MILWLRVITMLIAGFALGLTVTVGYLYIQVHRYSAPKNVPVYFVPAVALAQALLIFAVIAETFEHVIWHQAFEWWFSPLALPAFILIIYALLTLLNSPHLHRLEAEVQAHIHSHSDTSKS